MSLKVIHEVSVNYTNLVCLMWALSPKKSSSAPGTLAPRKVCWKTDTNGFPSLVLEHSEISIPMQTVKPRPNYPLATGPHVGFFGSQTP